MCPLITKYGRDPRVKGTVAKNRGARPRLRPVPEETFKDREQGTPNRFVSHAKGSLGDGGCRLQGAIRGTGAEVPMLLGFVLGLCGAKSRAALVPGVVTGKGNRSRQGRGVPEARLRSKRVAFPIPQPDGSSALANRGRANTLGGKAAAGRKVVPPDSVANPSISRSEEPSP